MKHLNSGLIILFISALLLLQPVVVLAQDSSASADQETASDQATPVVGSDTFTKPRQTEEILRLRELYQAQIEKYTNLERAYLINKAQFEKLGTLQSLEEAIKSTREVMLARTDVLITYFELMRASLADTEGVEITEQEKNVQEMIGYITALRAHREKILASENREDIAQRVDEFTILSKPFESTAYKSLALIRVGDIQTVFDKSEIIYKDVQEYHTQNPTTPLREQERQRAYKEVHNAIEKTRNDLLKVRTDYAEQKDLTRQSYGAKLAKSLDTTYSGTFQILSFLEELFVELT